MVFGMTKEQKRTWHKARPLLPVRLIDGRLSWLEPVERISYFAREIEPYTPHTVFGSWCYRLHLGEEA